MLVVFAQQFMKWQQNQRGKGRSVLPGKAFSAELLGAMLCSPRTTVKLFSWCVFYTTGWTHHGT